MECKDARDKIYSIRSIYPELFGGVVVNYDSSVEDVMVQGTISYMLYSLDLELLRRACDGPSMHGLPSWAIDWSRDTGSGFSFRIRPQAAKIPKPIRYFFSDTGLSLFAQGTVVDNISIISSDLGFENYRSCYIEIVRQFFNALWIFFHRCREAGHKTVVDSTMDLLMTILVDRDRLHVIKPIRGILSIVVSGDVYLTDSELDLCLKQPDSNFQSLTMAKFNRPFLIETLGEIMNILAIFPLFLTSKGRIALAENTQQKICAGDEVALIAGFSWPAITRRQSGGKSYTLVGTAYIPGMMEGQKWPANEQSLEMLELV
jgi:hypothetical protein